MADRIDKLTSAVGACVCALGVLEVANDGVASSWLIASGAMSIAIGVAPPPGLPGMAPGPRPAHWKVGAVGWALAGILCAVVAGLWLTVSDRRWLAAIWLFLAWLTFFPSRAFLKSAH